VVEVVTRGRVKWYRHVELYQSNWASTSGQLLVEGTKIKGRVIKTWNECVKVDMQRFGLVKDDAHIQDTWRNLNNGNRPTLPQCGNKGVILYGLRSRDVNR